MCATCTWSCVPRFQVLRAGSNSALLPSVEPRLEGQRVLGPEGDSGRLDGLEQRHAGPARAGLQPHRCGLANSRNTQQETVIEGGRKVQRTHFSKRLQTCACTNAEILFARMLWGRNMRAEGTSAVCACIASTFRLSGSGFWGGGPGRALQPEAHGRGLPLRRGPGAEP